MLLSSIYYVNLSIFSCKFFHDWGPYDCRIVHLRLYIEHRCLSACVRACVDAGRQRACMCACVVICVRAWTCMCAYVGRRRSPGDKYLGFFLEYCNARFSQYMYANLTFGIYIALPDWFLCRRAEQMPWN